MDGHEEFGALVVFRILLVLSEGGVFVVCVLLALSLWTRTFIGGLCATVSCLGVGALLRPWAVFGNLALDPRLNDVNEWTKLTNEWEVVCAVWGLTLVGCGLCLFRAHHQAKGPSGTGVQGPLPWPRPQ